MNERPFHVMDEGGRVGSFFVNFVKMYYKFTNLLTFARALCINENALQTMPFVYSGQP